MQNASSVFADSPDIFDHDPLVSVWSFHLVCPPNPSEGKCYDLGFSADPEAKVDGQLENLEEYIFLDRYSISKNRWKAQNFFFFTSL